MAASWLSCERELGTGYASAEELEGQVEGAGPAEVCRKGCLLTFGALEGIPSVRWVGSDRAGLVGPGVGAWRGSSVGVARLTIPLPVWANGGSRHCSGRRLNLVLALLASSLCLQPYSRLLGANRRLGTFI